MDSTAGLLKVRCIECKEEKLKVLRLARRADGRKVYIGEDGKWWSGRKCPDCKYAKKNRIYIKIGEDDVATNSFTPDPETTRKCRVCNKALPKSRYFACTACTSSQEETYTSETYGYSQFMVFSEEVDFKISELAIMAGEF